MLEISSGALRCIIADAHANPARERCGLLFGDPNYIVEASLCANVAADAAHTFEIDPAALFAALRGERAGGPRLAGYWHSHPSGNVRPSATDAAMASPDGKIWLIVGGGDVMAWRAGKDLADVGFTPVPYRVGKAV